MAFKPRLSFIDRPSPNFNDRKGQSVIILVLHYTAMDTAEAAIQRLCDPAAQVSSHYVIDKQGVIYRLVDETKRAWHAGESFWDGHTDLNSSSIGIEIDNIGTDPYPAAQMASVQALCQDIVKRYKMRAIYVVAHSDIAPDRKEDPGPQFDWPGLSTNGVGIYPAPATIDYTTSAKWQAKDIMNALASIGYHSTVDQKTLVTAFQRHFVPDVFKNADQVGVADVETRARMANLVRRKKISEAMLKRSASRKAAAAK